MYKKILNCNELWIGEKKGVMIDGVPVLIIRTDTGVYAFHDRCPHAGARLSEGILSQDNVITCARHGWQFGACTGIGVNPANEQLCQYKVRVDEANDIWVDIGKK